MALVDPRNYNWVPDANWPSNPFVTGEGEGDPSYPYRYHLTAGDEHRIPFPRRILREERYWRARSCRVRLFVQTGGNPYQGVDYVMEIQLSGERSVTADISALMRRISPGIPRLPHVNPLLGGVGQGIMSVFRPSPLASESHWTREVHLGARRATVRYDYLPPQT